MIADWWDLLTARASIRWRPVRAFYTYRGLRRAGRTRRDALTLARNAR